MLQQVMTKPGEIIFREVPVPEVKDDQVLVKIMNIGICGSDIHVYHGKHPFTSYPVTQGHEVSGEVVKLGKDVTVFHEGQKVTIEPQMILLNIIFYRLSIQSAICQITVSIDNHIFKFIKCFLCLHLNFGVT